MGNISKQTGAMVARASAVLTTSAVAAATLPVQNTVDGTVMVDIDFTLGSLTSATFTPQVSDDGVTNWRNITDPGALGPLVASGQFSFPVICKGKKYFRVTAIGVGTVTSSLAAITYRWQAYNGLMA